MLKNLHHLVDQRRWRSIGKLRQWGGAILIVVRKGPLFVWRLSVFWVFFALWKSRSPAQKKNYWREDLCWTPYHYSKWQQNQRVHDAVAKAAPGEARLRKKNAGFGLHSSATTTKATIVPVLLPPTMQQPPGTLLQPVVGVIVGGTMVGGAPPTSRDDGNKCQQGKDRVGTVHCRHCKYCAQHGRSFE